MLRIAQGRVYDPANGVDGDVRDICLNGGKVVEQFNKPEGYGGAPSLRFHIPLAALPPLSASP